MELQVVLQQVESQRRITVQQTEYKQQNKPVKTQKYAP